MGIKKAFGPIYSELPDEFIDHVKQQAQKSGDSENYLRDAGKFLQDQVIDGKLTKLGRYYVYGEELAQPEKQIEKQVTKQQTAAKKVEPKKQKKEDDELEFL